MKMIICKNCHELKPLFAKELCHNCYRKQHVNKKLIVCKECGEVKPHYAKGLCYNCYKNKNNKSKPMSENKSCSQYLGIVVTEKLLLKRFKNTKEMPNGNKGFDFVCNKDKKIDAKSSILNKRYIKTQGSWKFNIKKNKIADYFCCVGYDNREDLNVIKAWLIPSSVISKRRIVVNDLTTLKITKGKTEFWEQYEMDIDILDDCCTTMKKE